MTIHLSSLGSSPPLFLHRDGEQSTVIGQLQLSGKRDRGLHRDTSRRAFRLSVFELSLQNLRCIEPLSPPKVSVVDELKFVANLNQRQRAGVSGPKNRWQRLRSLDVPCQTGCKTGQTGFSYGTDI